MEIQHTDLPYRHLLYTCTTESM